MSSSVSRSLKEGKNSFLPESWRASTSAAASAAAAASLSRWVDTSLRVLEGVSSNRGRPFTITPDPASRSRRSAALERGVPLIVKVGVHSGVEIRIDLVLRSQLHDRDTTGAHGGSDQLSGRLLALAAETN